MRENDEEFVESDRAMLDKMRDIYEENWEQLTTITQGLFNLSDFAQNFVKLKIGFT